MQMINTNVANKHDLLGQQFANYTRERDFLSSAIPGMDNPKGIQVVEAKDMTPAVFKNEFVNHNKPCVIKGAINHWPAIEKWRDRKYWLKTSKNVPVYLARNNGHEVTEKTNIGLLKMNFHDAINRLYDNVDFLFYVQEVMPEIFQDISGFHFLPTSFKPKNYVRNRLLIQRRSFTTWHAHFVDEFLLCQVNGAKKVMLFSPNIPADLGHVCSFLRHELYLEGETLDKSLDFNPMVAELAEGDALYIPPYWHHAVHPLHSGINFSIVHCWASPIHKFGKFSNYFVKRIYEDKLWPIGKKTPAMLLLAISSFVLYTLGKMTKKVSDQYL
ncbi:MAG: hypothetical protein C0490_11195 [Marivirga sp.]|nr:hypothetical protein [Marivirga sp.]